MLCRKLNVLSVLVVFVCAVSLCAAVQAANIDLQMNEGSGLPQDSSGNGNHVANFIGSPAWTADGGGYTGAAGDYGIDLDGSGILQVNNAPSITITGAIDISVWIKPTGSGNTIPVGGGQVETLTREMGLYSKGGNVGGVHQGYGAYIPSNANLHGIFAFQNAGIKDFFASAVIAGRVVADQWNHVNIWFDGSTKYGITLNGVALALDGGMGTLPAPDSLMASSRNLYIGHDQWTGQYVDGTIDAFVITPEPATMLLLGLGGLLLRKRR